MMLGLKLQNFIALTKAYRDAEDGATAIEYGLMAALVALAIIVGVSQLGESIWAFYPYVEGIFTETADEALSGLE